MKQRVIIIVVLTLLLTGCGSGVSIETYNNLKSEKENLVADFEAINDKYSELNAKYQDIQSDLKSKDESLKKYEAIISIEDEIALLEEDKKSIESEIIELKSERDLLMNEVNSLNDEIKTLKSNKKEILSSFKLGQGQYIVGEDLDPGKYNITAITGSGNFQGKIESLGGYDYSLNEIMAKKGSDFWGDGYDTYSNLRLQSGDVFTISNGLKLQFDKID